jgi:hypothetical protein
VPKIRQVSPSEDRDGFMVARRNCDIVVADSNTHPFRGVGAHEAGIQVRGTLGRRRTSRE